jgi:hypothetical protein
LGLSSHSQIGQRGWLKPPPRATPFWSDMGVAELKALKSNLKAWNEEDFGNVERKKQLLLVDLQVLEGLEEERGLVKEEIMRKVVVALLVFN